MKASSRSGSPRLVHLAAAALLLALLVAACGGDSPADRPGASPGAGGTVVIGSISDVDSWNEYRSQQSFSVALLQRVFLRLARQPRSADAGPDDYSPVLAESWSRSEDGLSLTFKLRDAVWSDGRPITAEDVRFTWQAQISPQVAWVGAGNKEHITDVEVVDARTVTFHFDLRYPYQIADAVDGGIVPAHRFGEVPFDQWNTYDWSTLSIASGPFVLADHRPGVETVLERNPRYFVEQAPRIDRVVVRYVPDAGNLLTQLLAGEIDYFDGVPPREAHRLATSPDLTLIPCDFPGYDYLGWNGSRPPFDDSSVRRALTLAIDREALVEDLLFGYGRVSRGPVPSSWWGASREVESWRYDPDEAARILADRGYAVTEGAGRPSPAGRPLELELLTNSGNRLREEMLVKIQEQLARVGVRAAVRPLEMRSMRERIASGDYDGYLGGWLFTGRVELAVFFRSDGAYNVVNYRSDEVDRMLERLSGASDWREMQPVLNELQARIHQDQPYTFLYEKERIAAHGRRLGGVEIDTATDPLAWLEHAWVK